MTRDEQWAALRTWLREMYVSAKGDSAEAISSQVWFEGKAFAYDSVLDEMRRLARQRPKTGAKK